MPPKGSVVVKAFGKGKAKAKGKGRGKGAAKGKAKGKAKAAARAARAAAAAEAEAATGAGENGQKVEAEEEQGGEKLNVKPSAIRKKVLASLGEKSLEEAMEEQKMLLQKTDAVVAEADALRTAQESQIKNAQLEYEKVQGEVETATEQEIKAATNFKTAKAKRDAAQEKISEARTGLMDAEKKIAMLEVMYENARKMKELEARRREATEAAQLAKEKMALMKQREKAALEATKAALEQARQQAKGVGRGIALKRPGEPAAAPAGDAAAPPPEKRPAVEGAVQNGDDIE